MIPFQEKEMAEAGPDDASMNLRRDTTILVVDDNTNNLGVLYRYLDDAGFTVLVSQDGERAATMARDQEPDLILLDIMLPGMDGFDTCRQLKNLPATAGIPVIFISALTDIQDKVRGFEAGGVDYVTKPFQQEEVLARIDTHLTIKRQREELNRLNATKDKFFSIIAHDLRSPFMGLLGALELLRDSGGDMDAATQREMVNGLYESSQKTYNLLVNLLEWSRSQQGSVEVHPRTISLATLVREVADLFTANAHQKEVTITIDIPGDLLVHVDRDMISTVIRNLINNAVKFTASRGSVTVGCEMQGDFVAVTVTDNGIGIAPEDVRTLFTLEHTVSRNGTHGEPGTGLGLILAHDYVTRSGGQISVTSEPGKGSEFRFTLPVAPE
ncbi:MAG: HAMP domain-containing histidine kinase [Spirochaetales bacterium]|nr:MAG: HAMP domain-containing histidine kinase [Spirochaetales bacterium]